MRPCSVQLHDILNLSDTEQHWLISKCRTKNCKTCNILFTDANFTSNLTNTNDFTRSYMYDDLNCISANVVYGLECNLYGLVYVGETKGKLHKRICGHRSVSLTMLIILFISILINLIIRSFAHYFSYTMTRY